MGSFNYNLHVKCDDPNRVAAAIGQLLAQDGWRLAAATPDEQLRRQSDPATRRGLWVSTPVYGWVSVLDSDVEGAMSLATPLAEQLDAHTLLCIVNDSDSWMFALSRGDGLLDEFDSAGPGGVAAELPPEQWSQLDQGLRDLQDRLADGSLQQHVQQLMEEMLEAAPPEIQQCQARMQQGQATAAEQARYQAWAAAESPKLMGRFQEIMGPIVPGVAALKGGAGKSKKRKRKATKAQREAALQRIDNLRPLFVAGVTDERLQAVLDEKAVFAEETLAKFLPLVGIPGFYSYVEYDHKDEATPEELAGHGIQFAQHLMFETDP